MGAFGVPQDHFAVDLTIARGLDYYTGTVYETVMTDHPEIGSICSGGRYDNLAEYYTDKQLPGVGISIGLTRLFYVLEEQGLLNQSLLTAPADVLILPMTEDLGPAITLATQLRAASLRAQLYNEPKKFKAKISYADKLGIPYVIFLGEDEVAAGAASIKEMATGQQQSVPLDKCLHTCSSGWLPWPRESPFKKTTTTRDRSGLLCLFFAIPSATTAAPCGKNTSASGSPCAAGAPVCGTWAA